MEELKGEVSICRINSIKNTKLEVQNSDQSKINKIFGGLFNSKKESLNISMEEYQRQWFEKQMNVQNQNHRDSIRMMSRLPKQNMIYRAATHSRNLITSTLLSVLLQLVMLVISLTIIIWVLNLCKTSICDGLDKLSLYQVSLLEVV